MKKTNLNIKPRIYLKIHLLIILILIMGNIFSLTYIALNLPFGIDKLFLFSEEANIPTLFSSISLLISSLILYLISQLNKIIFSQKKYWRMLSFIFIFLAIDETAGIHEKVGSLISFKIIDALFLTKSWVVVYGIFLILFCFYFRNFLIKLDKKFRIGFILSGFIYLIGALGFEIFADYIISNPFSFFKSNYFLIMSTIITMEDTFEMVGIAIFNFYLLQFITKNKLRLIVVFK